MDWILLTPQYHALILILVLIALFLLVAILATVFLTAIGVAWIVLRKVK